MSALAWGIDSSANQGAHNETGDGGIGKSDARGSFTDEQTTAHAMRSSVLYVVDDRFARLNPLPNNLYHLDSLSSR